MVEWSHMNTKSNNNKSKVTSADLSSSLNKNAHVIFNNAIETIVESEDKMKKETIEFLRETQEILKELEMSKENVLQLESELEDSYDIVDDDERIDEEARLEREHSDEVDYVEYLEKQISENFNINVAKDLMSFINVDEIDFSLITDVEDDNQKVSVQ